MRCGCWVAVATDDDDRLKCLMVSNNGLWRIKYSKCKIVADIIVYRERRKEMKKDVTDSLALCTTERASMVAKSNIKGAQQLWW